MVAITVVGLTVATVDLVDGDDPAPTADTVQQAVATPSAAPSAAPRSGEVVGPTTSRQRRRTTPRATPPPAPAPAEPEGACADADVSVRPEVAPAVAGGRVVVTLALHTREAEACTWTLGEEHLAYKILDADGADVWTSSDCPGQVPSASVVVRRDLVSTYRLAWNGRESSRDCPDSMPAVDAGTYAVQAAAIGGEPSEVVEFTLRDPADLEPAAPVGPAVPKVSKSKARSRSKATARSAAR